MKNTILIGAIVLSFHFLSAQHKKESDKKWFPKYDFSAKQFQNPVQEFGPFARWWWPGNDVKQDELKHEVKTFAENGFAGVEIQPFSINVPMTSESVRSRVLSWDTPSYYQNLKAVLEEAKKQGLIIDLTDGSGWPAGGPFLDVEDGFLNLLYKDTDVIGGKTITIKVPGIDNETNVPSKLIAVVASKAISKVKKTTQLDASSTIILTDKVKNDAIIWTAPEGNWKVIAFWARPNSATGSMVAASKQGPVLNHLDSTKVFKNLAYLFRKETGLAQYFGKPLRAVFDDSYEFTVDRHFANDFIAYFKKKRGYDITPWLAANMVRKYNYVAFKNPLADPYFSFSDEDWRLRRDYDLTISEMLGENFIASSRKWLEKNGMLHRTQAYGMYMDMIANAGKASIPETETMLRQEVNLKVMSSGAHLYNRPVVSAESIVNSGEAYKTTPQKIRMAVDKLFAAGVNQIIYHGIPYKYVTNETTDLGWYPFYMGTVGFSAHLGEGTQFWKYQKDINKYIARTQYALRSGKPKADVLIYFPFMTVEGLPDNPEEIFIEGEQYNTVGSVEKKADKHATKEKTAWAKMVYPIINELEAHGISWELINDESIQAANIGLDKTIDVRGNNYQTLIVAANDVIELQSAKNINKLSKEGMKLFIIGDLPTRQPSFLNWENNDKETAQLIKEAVSQINSRHFDNFDQWKTEIPNLKQPIKYKEAYSFTRQIERVMQDGSSIRFIWNKSDKWQSMALTLGEKFKTAYWLDAETGKIIPISNLKNVSYELSPYSTVILYANTADVVNKTLLSGIQSTVYNAEKLVDIKSWDVQVGSVSIKNTALFDWKTSEQLKFTSKEGTYKSSFQLNAIDKKTTYFIDLGKVCYTAHVKINGQFVGQRINAPYSLEITKFLKKGENTIEVTVTPGELNGLIGEAEKGNTRYENFKNKTAEVMSSGLIGPVVLLKK